MSEPWGMSGTLHPLGGGPLGVGWGGNHSDHGPPPEGHNWPSLGVITIHQLHPVVEADHSNWLTADQSLSAADWAATAPIYSLRLG